MSFTEDLVNSVAAYLAPNGSVFSWRESGVYPDAEFGIYAFTAPLQRDRHSLVLIPYFSSDDLTLSDSVESLQLDFYGTRLEVTRARDYAFDRLQGFADGTLGSIKVQRINRVSGAVLGIDEAGNLRATDNYELAVYKPSLHRQ